MESFFKEVCIRKPKIRKEFAAYIRSQGIAEEHEYHSAMFWIDLDIIEEYKQKMKEFGYA